MFHKRNLQCRAEFYCSYLVLAGGIATIALAAYLVVVCYTPLPSADGWTQIFVGASGQNAFSPTWLWHQHNEHRLLIPKLFLAVDLVFFAARQKFLLVSIFVFQFLLLAVLSWSMRVLGSWRGRLWRTGVGLVAFCLFCPTQWENLTWGFQTCFVLPGLFAALAFIALLAYWQRHDRGGGWLLVVSSMIAALAGTCSLASGLLLLPLLWVAALVLRLRRTVALAYLVVALLATGLYFYHYERPPQSSNPISSVRMPFEVAKYIATYFGSSWTYGSSWTHHNLAIAPWIGFIGLGCAAVYVGRWWRMRPGSQAFPIELILLILFCVGTACLTASGRVASGNGQAFAPRYQTIALLFWCCLGLLALVDSAGLTGSKAFLILQLLLLGVFLRGVLLAHYPWREAREHAFQQRATAAALLAGIDDREQIKDTFPDPSYVLNVLPYMREKKLSIFAEPQRFEVGEPLNSGLRRTNPEACSGAVQAITNINDGQGVRITGWIWNRQLHEPPKDVVVAAGDKVTGLGAVGDWLPVVRNQSHTGTSFIGFTAYAEPPSKVPFELYGISAGNAVCKLLGP